MHFLAEFCESDPPEPQTNGNQQGIIRLEGSLGAVSSTDMRVGKTVMLLPSLALFRDYASGRNPWGQIPMISSSFSILIEGTKKPGKFTVSACGKIVDIATTAELRCDFLRDMTAFLDRYETRLDANHAAVADWLESLARLRETVC